ncbi:MAG TPA: hypothetical protein VI382_04375, partial [Candidatus Manganitrophaceae bacterium]|nr:hypothetical protein [Candidatus Manganitrophaceae bacterium]
NGFRFPDDEEWKEIKEMPSAPLSLEVVLEGFINNDEDSAGVKKEQQSDFLLEEVEILAGAPIGKSGRVSVFGTIEVEQEGREVATGVDFATATVETEEIPYQVAIGSTYIQVNDLLGGVGSGLLNFRAGQWDISLPFLSHSQRVVKNRYFAQRNLGVLGGPGDQDRRAVELNGQWISAEGTAWPTHRYSVGASRTDLEIESRLSRPNLFATYSINFLERFTLGAIYKRDQVARTGPADIVQLGKYGVAGEAEVGPFIGTVGYFMAESTNDLDYNNVLAEILFLPNKKVVLGARYDLLDQEERENATASAFTARYNFVSGVYGLVEYRLLRDEENIAGSNDREERGRAFLVALF